MAPIWQMCWARSSRNPDSYCNQACIVQIAETRHFWIDKLIGCGTNRIVASRRRGGWCDCVPTKLLSARRLAWSSIFNTISSRAKWSRSRMGASVNLRLDANGAPRMTANAVLADLDAHVEMMDFCRIDAAFLTCPPAMCTDLEASRLAKRKSQAGRNRLSWPLHWRCACQSAWRSGRPS